MQKEWRVLPRAESSFIRQLSAYYPLTAQLLYNRGLKNQSEIEDFFNPTYEKLLDPFIFRDMEKAVKRLRQAIEKNEKIIIHGDYDADGVTSAAVLYKTLKTFKADVSIFIPHRELDGYGMNMVNVENFIKEGYKLLITVDCGITNVAEVARLNEAGVDVIITDHHQPPEKLPAAVALLDPKIEGEDYPSKELSGAGVVFKLAQALLRDKEFVEKKRIELARFGGPEGLEKWLLDIVAIGTVADVSPLIGENRILVKWGLLVLEKTINLGLKKLLGIIGNRKMDTHTISYQIAPRLNAAGRMNHASAAFELLISENNIEAERLAWELQKNNLERQRVTEVAMEQVRQQFLLQIEKQEIFFAFEKNWEPGIIGLIAGKLCDEFYRPVIVMTESLGRVIGSGRSIEGFNITHGLTTVSEFFTRYGGHSRACGFTLTSYEIIEKFQCELSLKAKEAFPQGLPTPFVTVDAELNLNEIDWKFLDELGKFEPFGEGNEKPRFLLKNLELVTADALGSDGRHLRLQVKQIAPRLHKMMLFGKANDWKDKLIPGVKFEAVCEVGKNEWNGNKEVECRICDLKLLNT